MDLTGSLGMSALAHHYQAIHSIPLIASFTSEMRNEVLLQDVYGFNSDANICSGLWNIFVSGCSLVLVKCPSVNVRLV